MNKIAKYCLLFSLFCLFVQLIDATSSARAGQDTKAPVISVEAYLQKLPHNPAHFTQGLFFYQNKLFESTGLYGQSVITVKAPETGSSLLERKLDHDLFGEGATQAWGNVYMLTWREETALILDARTLLEKKRFHYPGEG